MTTELIITIAAVAYLTPALLVTIITFCAIQPTHCKADPISYAILALLYTSAWSPILNFLVLKALVKSTLKSY